VGCDRYRQRRRHRGAAAPRGVPGSAAGSTVAGARAKIGRHPGERDDGDARYSWHDLTVMSIWRGPRARMWLMSGERAISGGSDTVSMSGPVWSCLGWRGRVGLTPAGV